MPSIRSDPRESRAPLGPCLYQEPKRFLRQRRRPYLFLGILLLSASAVLIAALLVGVVPHLSGPLVSTTPLAFMLCAAVTSGTAGYFLAYARYQPRFAIYEGALSLPFVPTRFFSRPGHIWLRWECVHALQIMTDRGGRSYAIIKPYGLRPAVRLEKRDVGAGAFPILERYQRQLGSKGSWLFSPYADRVREGYTEHRITQLFAQRRAGAEGCRSAHRSAANEANAGGSGAAPPQRSFWTQHDHIRLGDVQNWVASGRYWSKRTYGYFSLIAFGILFWLISGRDYFIYPPFLLLTAVLFLGLVVPSLYGIGLTMRRALRNAGGVLKSYDHQWRLRGLADGGLSRLIHRISAFFDAYHIEHRVRDQGSRLNEQQFDFSLSHAHLAVRVTLNPATMMARVAIVPVGLGAVHRQLCGARQFPIGDRDGAVSMSFLQAAFDEMFELERIYKDLE